MNIKIHIYFFQYLFNIGFKYQKGFTQTKNLFPSLLLSIIHHFTYSPLTKECLLYWEKLGTKGTIWLLVHHKESKWGTFLTLVTLTGTCYMFDTQGYSFSCIILSLHTVEKKFSFITSHYFLVQEPYNTQQVISLESWYFLPLSLWLFK